MIYYVKVKRCYTLMFRCSTQLVIMILRADYKVAFFSRTKDVELLVRAAIQR